MFYAHYRVRYVFHPSRRRRRVGTPAASLFIPLVCTVCCASHTATIWQAMVHRILCIHPSKKLICYSDTADFSITISTITSHSQSIGDPVWEPLLLEVAGVHLLNFVFRSALESWDLRYLNSDIAWCSEMITIEEEQILREINAEPVKVFLQAALLSKTKGDSYNYNHIIHQLRVRDDQEMVACVYVGLSSCVSQFTPRWITCIAEMFSIQSFVFLRLFGAAHWLIPECSFMNQAWHVPRIDAEHLFLWLELQYESVNCLREFTWAYSVS